MPDPEARYKFGWVVIGITFLILVVNISVMLRQSISDALRSCKLKRLKKQYNKNVKLAEIERVRRESIAHTVSERMRDPLRNPHFFYSPENQDIRTLMDR